MARDSDRRRIFTRRALMVGGMQGALLCVLAGRLYQLQVVESERYATLAEDNRIDLRLIAPTRGRILDREGRVLAGSRQEYRVLLVAEQATDVDSTLSLLRELVGVSDEERDRVLREMRRTRKFLPVAVRENLAWEDVARVEVNALDLPGVSVDEGHIRTYPYGPLMAHILGYVAPVAENDAVDDPIMHLPDFKIGKAGVEKVYEQTLRGVGGAAQIEVNAVGRPIRELARKDGTPGQDLRLSLDLELQQFAAERFGDESGAAVLIDAITGELLALVSTPGYDPNLFGSGISTAAWRGLTQNPKAPLINKAVSGQYAPGSTFKPVVALAGLERAVITPSTVISCRGAMSLGPNVFHCWKSRGHGALSLRDALAQSCDVYFYETARRCGVEKIAQVGNRLGLGVKLGIDLPHERSGLLPTPDWKQARFGKGWSAGETVITGIGQGYVLSTPLQLAVMTARLASGKIVVPRVAMPDEPAPLEPLDFAPSFLKVIRDGMVAVVARGTAARAAIRQAGFEMAGKTGTSQVRTITKAERARGVIKNENLPWERRDHALFIGWAPVASPRYAIAVIVEHGGGGSKAAAPIARDILVKAQQIRAEREGEEAPRLHSAESSPRRWGRPHR